MFTRLCLSVLPLGQVPDVAQTPLAAAPLAERSSSMGIKGIPYSQSRVLVQHVPGTWNQGWGRKEGCCGGRWGASRADAVEMGSILS